MIESHEPWDDSETTKEPTVTKKRIKWTQGQFTTRLLLVLMTLTGIGSVVGIKIKRDMDLKIPREYWKAAHEDNQGIGYIPMMIYALPEGYKLNSIASPDEVMVILKKELREILTLAQPQRGLLDSQTVEEQFQEKIKAIRIIIADSKKKFSPSTNMDSMEISEEEIQKMCFEACKWKAELARDHLRQTGDLDMLLRQPGGLSRASYIQRSPAMDIWIGHAGNYREEPLTREEIGINDEEVNKHLYEYYKSEAEKTAKKMVDFFGDEIQSTPRVKYSIKSKLFYAGDILDIYEEDKADIDYYLKMANSLQKGPVLTRQDIGLSNDIEESIKRDIQKIKPSLDK